MRQLGLIGLLALVAVSWPDMAQAQSDYIRGALDRLDAVDDGTEYNATLSFDVSLINAGQRYQHSFVATASNAVRVSAACDTDCNLMQLRVVDFQNRNVAYEEPFAGASTLQFYPQAGQTYWVYAQPMDCSEAYCYVAVGIWQ